MAKYTAYKGTRYEYKTIVPESKKFRGKIYHLVDIFPNYGTFTGHRDAISLASQLRAEGKKSRVDAHSGYTAVYYM